MKKEKITGVGFIVVIVIMLYLIVIGVYQKAISKEDNSLLWNAEEYYPLEKMEIDSGSFIISILNKITSVQTKIEDNVSKSFYYRMPFILTKKKFDKMFGLDMNTSLNAGKNDLNSVNDVVISYSEHSLGRICDNIDISQHLDSLVQFGQKMEAEERNFLFFENPEKFKGNEIYIDYSEEKHKEIQKAFDDNALTIISAKDIEEAYSNELPGMFYKTDHHWTPSSGIWADGILCDYLNKRYGYDFNTSLFDLSNYEVITSDIPMMGSLGKKVTEVYFPTEEFQLYLPCYETDLEVFISTNNISSGGSIQETLLDYSVFDTNDIYNTWLYDFYGYGNQALIRIHNKNITDGSHILLLKTSFADCMYPYLAAVIEDLDVIDLRYFNGSLESYIKQTDPDTIVVIYGLGSFDKEEAFDFR